MDLLGGLGLWGAGLTGWIIPFLFVLSIVVFFHELGHFLIARWCGVKVLTFSIGFGPELVGFDDRHGTRWKFFGDENAASTPDQAAIAAMTPEEKRGSFFHKTVGQRVAVVAAGPLANFLLAIVIFAAVFMIFGKSITSARVDTVNADSAAAAAGLQPGDLVVAIDGRKIETFNDMQRIVSASAGRSLEIGIDRGGVRMDLRATPDLREVKDRFGNVHRIGVLGITRSITPDDVR